MPLHAQTAAVLEFMRQMGAPPLHELTAEQGRTAYLAMRVASTVQLPEVRDFDAGGVKCRHYRVSSHNAAPLSNRQTQYTPSWRASGQMSHVLVS